MENCLQFMLISLTLNIQRHIIQFYAGQIPTFNANSIVWKSNDQTAEDSFAWQLYATLISTLAC